MTRNNHKARFVCGSILALLVGCAYEEMKIVAQTGGASNNGTGGRVFTGENSHSGGTQSSVISTGGSATPGSGGTKPTGGTSAKGGTSSSGGSSGTKANDGTLVTGGTIATGGSSTAVGGTSAKATTTIAVGGSVPTGGATAAGGTIAAGGVTSMGGALAAGGTTAGGGVTSAGSASTSLTGGVSISGHYYQQGALQGDVWIASDSDGSTLKLADSEMCVTGKAIQVPLLDGGAYDYNGAWGLLFGCNLNQTQGVDGGPAGLAQPADVSAFASVTVRLNGAAGLSLRVQLEVVDTDGTHVRYCASLSDAGGTIDLASLLTNCWTGGTPQSAFIPATMQPINLGIAVVTSTKVAYPFNFCVTELKFNAAGAL